jgi:uncharacterized membrane protein
LSFGQNPTARLTFKTRLVTLVVILSQALGNWSLAWGMKHDAANMAFSPIAVLRTVFSPWIGLGIVLLILWLLSRLALLSWADLSYVLPVTSVSYVISAILGKYSFAERISAARWAGIALIVAGTALVGRTRRNTTQAASSPQCAVESFT